MERISLLCFDYNFSGFLSFSAFIFLCCPIFFTKYNTCIYENMCKYFLSDFLGKKGNKIMYVVPRSFFICNKKVSDIELFFCKITLELCKLLPEHLQKEFMNNNFISGGCIYGFIHDVEYDDYDFFLKNKNIACKIKTYFTKDFIEENNLNVSIFNEEKEQSIMKYKHKNIEYIITDKAITIIDDNGKKYQIIYGWCGDTDYIIRQFDFHHCMFAYDNGSLQHLVYFARQDLESDAISYNEKQNKKIENSFIRMVKYINRGMKIKNMTLFSMLSKANPEYFKTEEMFDKFYNSDVDY